MKRTLAILGLCTIAIYPLSASDAIFEEKEQIPHRTVYTNLNFTDEQYVALRNLAGSTTLLTTVLFAPDLLLNISDLPFYGRIIYRSLDRSASRMPHDDQ